MRRMAISAPHSVALGTWSRYSPKAKITPYPAFISTFVIRYLLMRPAAQLASARQQQQPITHVLALDQHVESENHHHRQHADRLQHRACILLHILGRRL